MYDANFYDLIRPGCQSSANEIIPWLFNFYWDSTRPIRHVIDIGCGEGWFGAKLGDLTNAHISLWDNDGFDSPNRAEGNWSKLDLENFTIDFQPDLIICLEVAEHLTEKAGRNLVKEIAKSTDHVLWSAAIPGQGGHGHINEQWSNYWIHQFNELGFTAEPIGLEFWGNEKVEPWYQQNLLWFSRTNVCLEKQYVTSHIHPAFWKTRLGL